MSHADLNRLSHAWLTVCKGRGTPAPDPIHTVAFLGMISDSSRERLSVTLAMSARGQEDTGALNLLSWAAACTRPSVLARLYPYGLNFSGPKLFEVGLKLAAQGWDMSQRLAQLADNPRDVDVLRGEMPIAAPAASVGAIGTIVDAEPEMGEDSCQPEVAAAFNDAGPWEDEKPSVESVNEGADLPTRYERQGTAHVQDTPNESPKRLEQQPPVEVALNLRLFGKSAAHTLTVTSHRRGGDFLGVQVITIESARALVGREGYDWSRKLVLQLMPEEMAGVVATLMGIHESCKFDNHGSDHTKFIELRRQAGGIVIVTGDTSTSYTVPVRSATAYYILDLFCRAMASNTPGRTATDILTLVKSVHGF